MKLSHIRCDSLPKERKRKTAIKSYTFDIDVIAALKKLKEQEHITVSSYINSLLEKDPKIAPIINDIRFERTSTNELEKVKSFDGFEFQEWVLSRLDAKKPDKDRGVDGIVKGKIPIQVKALEKPVSYDVISQFNDDVKFHPDLQDKLIEKIVIVSQNGFDDSAESRARAIEKRDNIKVVFLTPKDIISGNFVLQLA